jgi:hypothetical protein
VLDSGDSFEFASDSNHRGTDGLITHTSDVGSAFLLGGGISFLSPSIGYGADSFVELDVVLVNGTLVTATVDNEYSDLFKALKGGANRFGIVTRYEVRAIHTGQAQDKTWHGGLVTVSFTTISKAFLTADYE